MKKIIFAIVLAAALIVSCNSRERPAQTEARGAAQIITESRNFSDVIGREWKLIEVRINGENTGFSRDTVGDAFREAFTLRFDAAEMVSGTGAPNLYSAPYSLGENQSIRIMMMRSTMMASIFEPEGLSEFDFFNYVQNTSYWSLTGGRLNLHSTSGDDEVVLIFAAN